MSVVATVKAAIFRSTPVRRLVFAYRFRYGWQSHSLERQDLAAAYLSGRGLEIGALQFPLPVPRSVRITYVDRMTTKELRAQYPELREHPLVPVALVDNGETLRAVADGSQYFVVACQFLEHCENPIGAVENFLRVVREGGILYLAIPNRDYTFDRSRSATPLAHLWNDYEGRPEWSRERHFQEFSRAMSVAYHPHNSEVEVTEDAVRLMAQNYSIHYHVWDMESWMAFLLSLRERFGFHVECVLRHRKKSSPSSRRQTALTIGVLPTDRALNS